MEVSSMPVSPWRRRHRQHEDRSLQIIGDLWEKSMMKNFVSWALGAAVVAISASLAQQAAADLYVTQVGDGSAALSNASTAVFVQKFAVSGGSPLSTIALPTVGAGANLPLTNSGTATSEGFLALSSNGQYLTLGGYGVAPGTASIASTESGAVNRVVGRIELSSGAVDTTTAFADGSFSQNNIRSVVSTDGQKFWVGGNGTPAANGGVRYATLGSTTSAQITSSPTNIRVVKIFDGQLYASTMAGAFRGVSTVGVGVPEAADSATLLPGFDPATNSPQSVYDFWFKDDNTLYVADDRSAASGGGIQKWLFDGAAWSLSYTLGVGTGARGLAGAVDGENVTLYATTTQNAANNLVAIVDSGASSTFSVLASAPANTAFRGVAYVPSGISPPGNNADFNGDNIVDGADFLIWQRGFGLTGQPNKSTGDANGDGNVNGLDLDQWKSKFGGAPRRRRDRRRA
jgi:hypothetical protein